MGSKNLYVRISDEHDALLRSVAEAANVSLREAVEMLIDAAVRPAAVPTIRRRALVRLRAEVTE